IVKPLNHLVWDSLGDKDAEVGGKGFHVRKPFLNRWDGAISLEIQILIGQNRKRPEFISPDHIDLFNRKLRSHLCLSRNGSDDCWISAVITHMFVLNSGTFPDGLDCHSPHRYLASGCHRDLPRIVLESL